MNEYTRRDVMKASGATALFGTGAAGIGLYAMPTVDADVQAEQTTVEGESDDGQVSDVELTATGSVEWSGLDADADYLSVTLECQDPDGNWQEMATDRGFDNPTVKSTTEPFEFTGPSGLLIADGKWGETDLSAGEDGETVETDVPVRITVTLVANDGSSLSDGGTQTVTVRVTNLEGEQQNVSVTVGVEGTVEMRGSS